MPRKYQRMRETVFDIYTERDAVPWYYRTACVAASWLALGGYVLFALVFTSVSDNTRASRTFLTVLASALLVAGYGSIAIIASFSHSLLFLFDAVLLPILTSSFMGIFVIAINYAIHKQFPVTSKIYVYVPLVVACVTTVGAGCLSYITYRKLRAIKELDRGRRQHVQRGERGSYGQYGEPVSTTELLPLSAWNAHNLPEDEAQRRQLLRLLLNREAASSPPTNNHRNSQTTYHINLPGETTESPNFAGLQVVQPNTRPRSGSLPNIGKWNILNRITRERSPTVESQAFKNPRERRREEIERSSVLLTPGDDHVGRRQSSGSPQPPQSYFQSPNPVWASGSTRYS